MKYGIIQTTPYPNVSFEVRRSEKIIGRVIRTPQKRQPHNYELNFLGKNIRITMNTHLFTEDLLPWKKPKSDPYLLFQGSEKCGELYHCHYNMLELDGCTYTMRSIDVDSTIKIPIWEGEFKKEKPTGKQLALIEIPSQDQTLHHQKVIALGEEEGLVALLLCVYFNNCRHNRNRIMKVTCALWEETQRKELMLYDPTFKERVAD